MKRFHVLAIVTCVTCGFLPAAAETISDLPKRKPGQWEIRLVTEKPAGTPAVVSHICIDPATDRELLEFGLRMSKKTCSRYDMKRVGKSWVIDAQCSLGPVSSATHTPMMAWVRKIPSLAAWSSVLAATRPEISIPMIAAAVIQWMEIATLP